MAQDLACVVDLPRFAGSLGRVLLVQADEQVDQLAADRPGAQQVRQLRQLDEPASCSKALICSDVSAIWSLPRIDEGSPRNCPRSCAAEGINMMMASRCMRGQSATVTAVTPRSQRQNRTTAVRPQAITTTAEYLDLAIPRPP